MCVFARVYSCTSLCETPEREIETEKQGERRERREKREREEREIGGGGGSERELPRIARPYLKTNPRVAALMVVVLCERLCARESGPSPSSG